METTGSPGPAADAAQSLTFTSRDIFGTVRGACQVRYGRGRGAAKILILCCVHRAYPMAPKPSGRPVVRTTVAD